MTDKLRLMNGIEMGVPKNELTVVMKAKDLCSYIVT